MCDKFAFHTQVVKIKYPFSIASAVASWVNVAIAHYSYIKWVCVDSLSLLQEVGLLQIPVRPEFVRVMSCALRGKSPPFVRTKAFFLAPND